jgi:iron complex outermembrane recepter protein
MNPFPLGKMDPTSLLRGGGLIMRATVVVIALCLSVLALAASPSADASIRKPTNIPAQELGAALHALEKDRNLQVIFVSEDVRNVRTQGAVGEFTSDEALKALLKGTGLAFRDLDEKTVTIVPLNSTSSTDTTGAGPTSPNTQPPPAPEGSKVPSDRFRVAQVDQGASSDNSSVEKKKEKDLEKKVDQLEEVVVTGTNIKGGEVTGPVFEIGQSQIEMGGFSTISEALNSLPLNFGGGINIETTAVSGISQDNSNLNLGGASSANLRGLGSNATLVLLNGRRLPAGGEGVSVDLSLIPLSVVDRIEVLADGASAIYGTDAVAGVVNIITRHNFDGFDSSVKYDAVNGAGPSFQVGQLAGFNWTGGNLTLGYQYDDRSALPVGARESTSEDTRPNDIYPGQTQNSGYLSANQQITSEWSAFAEGTYADRRNHYFGNAAPPGSADQPYKRSDDSSGGAITAGLDFEPGHNWLIEAFGTYARSDLSDVDLALTTTPPAPYDTSFRTEQTSAELRASGDVMALPGGMLRSSLGLSFRHEDFGTITTGAPNADIPRDVYAASAEFDIPLIGTGNKVAWLRTADLVTSARYEDYSDFGSKFNPKIGLTLSPLDGLQIKGDYSTSFRAPEGFEETDFGGYGKFMYPANDPLSPTGTSETLYLTGGNTSLKPETARSFTFTIEFKPPAVPGLSAMVDYYNIDFKNRILDPDPNALGLFDLTASTVQGLVTRNPTPAQIQAAFTLPGLCANLVGGSCSPAGVMAIVDGRDQNFASTRTSGLDFPVSYAWANDLGRWTASGAATYIINLDNQLSPTSSFQSLVNTIYNPVGFRSRAGLTWERTGWSAATFVNYVDSYHDNRNPAAVVPVGSWTTVALHLGYRFDDYLAVRGSGSTSISLDVSNLFDRAPPFVAPSMYGYSYDPTNSSVIGRVVGLSLNKRW